MCHGGTCPKEIPMLHRLVISTFVLCCAVPVAGEELPTGQEIVKRVIAAAGGEEFKSLGVIEFLVNEEEIRNDGTQSGKNFKLIVDTTNLNNLRMELPGEIVVGATQNVGWSTVSGALDDRPQMSTMARRSLNQMAFPLLLPFSLEMEGVWAKEVREHVTDDGREVWVLGFPFSKGFFMSPVLDTTWVLVVAKDDYSILSLEFAPAPAYQDVSPVGIRYRILKQKDLGGANVIEQLLAVGINSQYMESGSNRVTRIKSSVRTSRDITLFLSPAQIEAFEQD
jgi:hypothetical protein